MKFFFSKITIAFVFVLFLLMACSSSRQAQENTVGTVVYNQYALRTSVPSIIDTAYYAVTNGAAFDALFVSAANGTDHGPDFNGQTVVAITLPPTAKAKIERAAISGKALNVYIGPCFSDNANCSKNGLLLVTAPRSGSVKEVHFFSNGSLRRTVTLKN